MSNSRILITVFLLLITIGLASADYSDYSIDWKILPTEVSDPSKSVAYEDTDVLVFGYITLNDLNGVLPTSAFNLKVVEGASVKKDLKFSDSALVYLNDYDDSSNLLDGFFYTKLSDFDPGTYSVILSIDGEDIDYKNFEVITGSTDFFIEISTITVNKGPLLELNYSGTGTPDANLSFYGRKNFNNPTIFQVLDVANNASPEVTGFDLGDYVDDDQVYGFVVCGETTSDDPAEPQLLLKTTGFKSYDSDGIISLITSDLKKGVEESLSLSVENNGSFPTDYTIVLSGGLSSYSTTPSSLQVLPGETETVSLDITLPRDLTLSSDDLTITLKAEGSVVDAQTYNMTLIDADPIHSVIIDGVSFSKNSYFKGESVGGNITLLNNGDYDETVNVEYYFDSDDVNKLSQVMIPSGERKSINFYLTANDQSTLVVKVTNSNLDITSSFSANVINKNYDFSFDLGDSYIVSQNKLTETTSLIVENTGNVKDVFVVNSNYSYIEYSTRSLVLDPDETKTIDAIINIPSDGSDLNLEFTVCSQKGDECSTSDLLINVLYSGSGSSDSGSITRVEDISLTGNTEEGVIYSFDVTNNNLITKNYELTYQSSAAIDFSVYPGEDFTIQPGETKTLFLYAVPSEFGEYTISYSINEEGDELSSGNLELIAKPDFGLTGFAVSVGSTLGFVGLVVLVVFIYFYFIRGSSSGVEEFKPVEVKKADLTKAGVKNGNRYW